MFRSAWPAQLSHHRRASSIQQPTTIPPQANPAALLPPSAHHAVPFIANRPCGKLRARRSPHPTASGQVFLADLQRNACAIREATTTCRTDDGRAELGRKACCCCRGLSSQVGNGRSRDAMFRRMPTSGLLSIFQKGVAKTLCLAQACRSTAQQPINACLFNPDDDQVAHQRLNKGHCFGDSTGSITTSSNAQEGATFRHQILSDQLYTQFYCQKRATSVVSQTPHMHRTIFLTPRALTSQPRFPGYSFQDVHINSTWVKSFPPCLCPLYHLLLIPRPLLLPLFA